jgi:YebC/PmpR family DNA-binding regulatory protein
MSGHSKWATIKHQKAINDARRGKLFSRLSRAISIAVKSGGGPNPESNNKLRVAIEQARAANMPKANIEKAISRGGGGEALEEMTYEGYGPEGIAVMVEVATDNRNRTAQEIKAIFERGGGRLAGPGAVAFNFEPKGFLVVEKEKDTEAQMLKLIDLGVEDMEETQSGIEVYVEPDKLSLTRQEIKNEGFRVVSAELVQKPKSYQEILDEKAASKALSFLDNLDEHDDVQKVFANLDIPDEIVKKVGAN